MSSPVEQRRQHPRPPRRAALRTASLAGAAALLAAIGLGAPAGAPAASALSRPEVCPGVDAPAVLSAAPDRGLTRAFDDYADRPDAGAGHWTGADSTYSAPLPDGSDVWIFSDTFLGEVRPDGSRSPTTDDGGTTPFLNNTFVQTSRTGADTTVTGGTRTDPTALLPPPDSGHWYWARDGLLLDGRLDVVYSEFKRTGSGPLDFGWDRNVLARFAPGHLNRPVSVAGLPSATGISWGGWILRSGGYTYVYGSEDLGAHKYLHLARVPGGDLLRPWQYRTASGGWSPDESASGRLGGDGGQGVQVSNEFSVVRHGPVYVLVTQDMSAPLSAGIDLAYSCSPDGPFTDEATAYTTPETGQNGSYHDPDVYTYNPHEHQELGDRNHLVVSYNVNSFSSADLYRDASVYRPRFIDVTLGRPSE
jgi:hypothetical protein